MSDLIDTAGDQRLNSSGLMIPESFLKLREAARNISVASSSRSVKRTSRRLSNELNSNGKPSVSGATRRRNSVPRKTPPVDRAFHRSTVKFLLETVPRQSQRI